MAINLLLLRSFLAAGATLLIFNSAQVAQACRIFGTATSNQVVAAQYRPHMHLEKGRGWGFHRSSLTSEFGDAIADRLPIGNNDGSNKFGFKDIHTEQGMARLQKAVGTDFDLTPITQSRQRNREILIESLGHEEGRFVGIESQMLVVQEVSAGRQYMGWHEDIQGPYTFTQIEVLKGSRTLLDIKPDRTYPKPSEPELDEFYKVTPPDTMPGVYVLTLSNRGRSHFAEMYSKERGTKIDRNPHFPKLHSDGDPTLGRRVVLVTFYHLVDAKGEPVIEFRFNSQGRLKWIYNTTNLFNSN